MNMFDRLVGTRVAWSVGEAIIRSRSNVLILAFFFYHQHALQLLLNNMYGVLDDNVGWLDELKNVDWMFISYSSDKWWILVDVGRFIDHYALTTEGM